MNITVITDKKNNIVSSEFINSNFKNLFYKKNLDSTLIEIDGNDVLPCLGCFGCWIKTPGECVIKDEAVEINRKIISSEVVIYITPVVFGQYSYNMKNVVDRGLGKNLPFFKKFNGRTGHPGRYDKYPVQYAIGCIESNQKDDIDIFLDTHEKYRRDIKKVYICEKEEKMIDIARNILMEVNSDEEN